MDEIADKLIAGEFETKEDLREIDWDNAPEEWGLSLRVCNMVKKMLKWVNSREYSNDKDFFKWNNYLMI